MGQHFAWSPYVISEFRTSVHLTYCGSIIYFCVFQLTVLMVGLILLPDLSKATEPVSCQGPLAST